MYRNNRLGIFTVLIVVTIMSVANATLTYAADKEVNLYSGQKEHLIRPLLNQFEEQTGIKVNLVTGKQAALMARLEAEGEHTPADVLMMADVGNLYLAQEKGLLAAIESDVLNAQIPAQWRSPENYWFAVALRARALYVRKADEAPTSYSDLSAPKWKDGILVMSSDNIYNQSLMASIVAHEGEQAALDWAKAVVANMARAPEGNERDQMRALASGLGKVVIANSYYFGKLLHSKEARDRELASKLRIIFPDQETRGTHVNIRGAAMVKYATHTEAAKQLLEFLVSEPAQRYFTDSNYEYPIVQKVTPNATVAGWGTFKRDTLSLSDIGKLNRKAVELFDRAGWK